MTDIPCVGAVVLDDRGRLLLVQRANPPAQGLWSIPGGRLEPGETAPEGAVRELAEETGLVGEVVREVGTVVRDAPGGGRYVIRDFLIRVAVDIVPLAGDDAADVGWFTRAELDVAPTSPGLVDALVDWGLIDS